MARSFLSFALVLTALFFVWPDDAAAKSRTKKKPDKAAKLAQITKPARTTKPAATPVEPKTNPPGVDPYTALASELPIKADGAFVIDCRTGATLYEKNPDELFFPASTTKILTALLVIEAGNLDQEVVIDEEDAKVGESSLQIRAGDHFPRREMLYGLMLKSANDVAHALARDNAGSAETFAEKMTQRAQELGALNSHFVNPHGLHDPAHYTTPRDLALIARAAMQQPFFRRVVSTQNHPWSGPWGLAMLRNHNRLLAAFPGCTGLKTGFTRPAQQVLVSSALWGTREVICVVMHTDHPGIWEDSKLLLSFGLTRPSD